MATFDTANDHKVFCVGQFKNKSQKDIQDALTEIGVPLGSKDDYTVLIASDSATANKKKYPQILKEAIKQKTPVLTEDWLSECLGQSSWLQPESKHFLFPPENEGHLATPPDSRESTADPEDVRLRAAAEEQLKLARANGEEGTGANTTGANTTGANPTGANTTGANPTGAKPTGDNTTGANTTGANTTGADTTGADTTGANTTGANTTGADTSPDDTAANRFDQVPLGKKHFLIREQYLEKHAAERKILVDGREMTIECQLPRGYLIVTDPQFRNPDLPCAREGHLLKSSDYPTAVASYQNAVNSINPVSTKDSLPKEIWNFVWWATAYNGRICYVYGIVNGEKIPRVFSRSVFKNAYGSLADQQINIVREAFGQSPLGKNSKTVQQLVGARRKCDIN